LKYQLDSAAWVPGELNAVKNWARCNGGLATMPGEVNVRIVVLLSPFDSTHFPNWERKSLKSLEISARISCVEVPGELNAVKNCARCNRGLATTSGEVNLRFAVLLILFDRTQRPNWEGKVGQFT